MIAELGHFSLLVALAVALVYQGGIILAPGEYKVRVEPGDASLLAVKRDRGKARALPFPPKYLDEDSSTLTARVEPALVRSNSSPTCSGSRPNRPRKLSSSVASARFN